MEAEWSLGVVLTFECNYCEKISFVVKYFKTVIQEVLIKPIPWPMSFVKLIFLILLK